MIANIQITQIIMVPQKPRFVKGRGTFIPKKLVIKVGTIIIKDMVVSRFITIFKLFEITVEKASVMLDKIFV